MAKFGENVRKFRLLRRLTQSQLAKLAKIKGGQAAVNHYERGRREPGVTNIIKFCRALRVTPTQLIDTKQRLK